MKYMFLGLLFSLSLFSKEIEIIKIENNFETSGININEETKDIYLISDEGQLLKINNENKKQKIFDIDDKDFEAITFNKNRTYMFLVEEGNDNIYQIRKRKPFDEKTIYKLNRKFHGKTVINKNGDGLESLSYINEDEDYFYFYTANQSKELSGDDRASIIKISLNKSNKFAKIIEYIPISVKDISDLHYVSDNEIYFISDKENKLYKTNYLFNNFEIYDIPGKNQEALFVDKDKTVYIGEDKGNILIIRGLIK